MLRKTLLLSALLATSAVSFANAEGVKHFDLIIHNTTNQAYNIAYMTRAGSDFENQPATVAPHSFVNIRMLINKHAMASLNDGKSLEVTVTNPTLSDDNWTMDFGVDQNDYGWYSSQGEGHNFSQKPNSWIGPNFYQELIIHSNKA